MLLKLQEINAKASSEEDKFVPGPLPTVGINHYDVNIATSADKEREDINSATRCFPFLIGSLSKPTDYFLSIREFGGALAPAWQSYLRSTLESCDGKKCGIVFLVDISCASRFAEAGVHLLDTLSFFEHDSKSTTKVLIVFSKSDLLDPCSREKTLTEVTSLLRLDYLSNWCQYCQLERVVFSSETEEGLGFIFNWLRALYFS